MGNKKSKQVSFLDPKNGKIVELVGDQDARMFLVYDTLTEEVDFVDEYEFGDTVYIPPKDDLVSKGTILLPTQLGEYKDLASLISHIDDFIYKYLDVPDHFRKIAAYYVLLTWVYDCFEVLPYLRLLGDFGTGKTRFQKVVGSLCYKPMFAGGATTPSPIFRIIDLYRGTLILDEADFRLSDADAEIIKIFNCGYCKGIPVLRTEGEKQRIPTSYDVYGPKIIATRKKFQDPALESRCLSQVMTGKTRSDIPIHLPKEFDNEALLIRNCLLGFRLKNYGIIRVDESLAIPHLEPRINQIILSLLTIVKDGAAREDIVAFIKGYAQQLKNERGEELPAQILSVMVEIAREGEVLRYKEIADRFNQDRDKEQGEYLISPAKIGKLNSSIFNFETRRVNGVTEILWNKEKARSLCERYGIDFVDLIDLPEGHKESSEVSNQSFRETMGQNQSLPETLHSLQSLPKEDFETRKEQS